MSIRKLSPELQAKAIAEINEVPERIQDDLQHIKDWLKKQPHIKARTDDQWLLAFLRGSKFSLERTKEKLDTYYTMRTILPEFFEDRDPFKPEIQEILNLGMCIPLPKGKDPTSPRIVLIRSACYDPKKIDFNNIFKCNTMMIDIALLEDDVLMVAGEHVVQDMENSTMAHLAMPPSLSKKTMMYFQDSLPIRIKGMHFYNIPTFFEVLYSLVKPFMREKLMKRMIIYTSDTKDKLYETVPRELLPKEYGGEAGTIAELAAELKKKVESYADWFKEEAQYKTDERLRPGKPKTPDNVFGIEGSFRKLAVD